MKSHLAFALLLFTSWAPIMGQEGWHDYIGVYHLDSADVNGESRFWYFELLPGTGWKYLDTSLCMARWFPAGSRPDVARAHFEQFYLENDSISFRTTQCFGETYVFRGRFKMPANQFLDHEREHVLEGTLVLYRRGQLYQRIRAFFVYDSGGD